jgi:hypothetical protein
MHYFRTPGDHCLCGQVAYRAPEEPTNDNNDYTPPAVDLSVLTNLINSSSTPDTFGGFDGGTSGGAGASGDW